MMKPIWAPANSLGAKTKPNLIGWYNAKTFAIYTANGSLSQPAGGNRGDEALVMMGKKRPSKMFLLRYARMNAQLEAAK